MKKSLRYWFLAHFLIDMLIGIPLFAFPEILDSLGMPQETYLTARLVGAALLAIGGTSFLMHNKGKEIYKLMLDLKIIWASFSIISIFITFNENRDPIIWLSLILFGIFLVAWIYYKNDLQKRA